LKVWPFQVERGHPADVLGLFSHSGCNVQPPRTVTLLAAPRGTDDFQPTASTSSDGAGRFSFQVVPDDSGTSYNFSVVDDDGTPKGPFSFANGDQSSKTFDRTSPRPGEYGPCTGPDAIAADVFPRTVVAGERGVVDVWFRDGAVCDYTHAQPVRHLELYERTGTDRARRLVGSADTNEFHFVTFPVQPAATVTYSFVVGTRDSDVDQSLNYRPVSINLVRCDLALASPPTVGVGSAVTVTGQASGDSGVDVWFRRRGESGFIQRRTLSSDQDGNFVFSYTADDDYQYYATSANCTSPVALTATRPTLTGPASVKRNARVTITITAGRSVPIKVYMHKRGTTGYQLARTGTTGTPGQYVTAYRADTDYRYYAVTGPGTRQTNPVLTQVG
jgi:hypothetical protein